MISTGINLVMTVIGFAVSTIFIVFVCTRLICARIQLRASRRNFPTASRSDLCILERGFHGLEPFVVASFPTEEFGEHFSSGQDTQCTVCLAEYQEKDVLRMLPYCRHAFHVTCIDIWLNIPHVPYVEYHYVILLIEKGQCRLSTAEPSGLFTLEKHLSWILTTICTQATTFMERRRIAREWDLVRTISSTPSHLECTRCPPCMQRSTMVLRLIVTRKPRENTWKVHQTSSSPGVSI